VRKAIGADKKAEKDLLMVTLIIDLLKVVEKATGKGVYEDAQNLVSTILKAADTTAAKVDYEILCDFVIEAAFHAQQRFLRGCAKGEAVPPVTALKPSLLSKIQGYGLTCKSGYIKGLRRKFEEWEQEKSSFLWHNQDTHKLPRFEGKGAGKGKGKGKGGKGGCGGVGGPGKGAVRFNGGLICAAYPRGNCAGSSCPSGLPHVRAVCKAFNDGYCGFGESCKFLHEGTSEPRPSGP